jgi:hypothetical protein
MDDSVLYDDTGLMLIVVANVCIDPPVKGSLAELLGGHLCLFFIDFQMAHRQSNCCAVDWINIIVASVVA